MMPPYTPQNNIESDNPYSRAKNNKTGLHKLIAIACAVFLLIGVVVLSIYFAPSKTQDKYMESATIAARKHTPNAQVSQLKVAGNFAVAIVSDQQSTSQAGSGNATIFKVNKDDSMTQIANGSSFSPIDLLEFGIPLGTQAKLTSQNLSQVQQTLAATCGYSDGIPGYSGFEGSFNPSGWQIDSGTLDDIEQSLTATITNQNSKANPGKNIICVNATRKNSNSTTNIKTYISTFTLEIEFITSDGTITHHTFNFAIGPNQYRSYSLDSVKIPNE